LIKAPYQFYDIKAFASMMIYIYIIQQINSYKIKVIFLNTDITKINKVTLSFVNKSIGRQLIKYLAAYF